jgi:hypothetical protein
MARSKAAGESRPVNREPMAQRAKDEPDQVSDRSDEGAGDHGRPEIRRLPWRRHVCTARAEQVEAGGQEGAADHDPQRLRREPAGGVGPADRAEDGWRQHPRDEPPVHPAGADMRDRRRGGGEPGNRDIRPRGGRRIRPDEEQDGEPDVAEDEPEEAAGQGHEEAPKSDSGEDQAVHRLEYPG